MESGAGAPSDYNWTAQTPSGGSASWLNVDQSGVVTFNSQPSSAEKAVEIIATPKAGGQPLGYRFTLGSWFISNGNKSLAWLDANTYCTSQSGYQLPTIVEVTMGARMRGVGALWNEWGNLTALGYSGFSFTGKAYWSSISVSNGTHSSFGVIVGDVDPDSNDDSNMLFMLCRQGL